MTLSLVIKKGPLAGQNFTITDGATIGRKSTASIYIDDPKMSGIHAFFEYSADDGWFIKDHGSTNKIVVGQERLPELKLEPGVVFYLGKTLFEVVEKDSLLSQPWQDLLKLTNQAQSAVKNQPPIVQWFKNPIKLTFKQGSQYGASWLMEYGPCLVGSKVLEYIIEDELCPDCAFEIKNSDEGPLFSTKYPEIVKLNSENVSESPLKNNDTISIRYSTLVVEIKNV